LDPFLGRKNLTAQERRSSLRYSSSNNLLAGPSCSHAKQSFLCLKLGTWEGVYIISFLIEPKTAVVSSTMGALKSKDESNRRTRGPEIDYIEMTDQFLDLNPVRLGGSRCWPISIPRRRQAHGRPNPFSTFRRQASHDTYLFIPWGAHSRFWIRLKTLAHSPGSEEWVGLKIGYPKFHPHDSSSKLWPKLGDIYTVPMAGKSP
jgi:hypothetical protein